MYQTGKVSSGPVSPYSVSDFRLLTDGLCMILMFYILRLLDHTEDSSLIISS